MSWQKLTPGTGTLYMSASSSPHSASNIHGYLETVPSKPYSAADLLYKVPELVGGLVLIQMTHCKIGTPHTKKYNSKSLYRDTPLLI